MNGKKVKKLRKLHAALNAIELNEEKVIKYSDKRGVSYTYLNPNRAAWRRLKKEYRNKPVKEAESE